MFRRLVFTSPSPRLHLHLHLHLHFYNNALCIPSSRAGSVSWKSHRYICADRSPVPCPAFVCPCTTAAIWHCLCHCLDWCPLGRPSRLLATKCRFYSPKNVIFIVSAFLETISNRKFERFLASAKDAHWKRVAWSKHSQSQLTLTIILE